MTNPTDTYEDERNREIVLCVQTNRNEPPHFVAEDYDELRSMDKDFAGEQCQNCGGAAYTIERNPVILKRDDIPLAWQARCSGNPDDAEQLEADGADPEVIETVRNGCGATYFLKALPAGEVVF